MRIIKEDGTPFEWDDGDREILLPAGRYRLEGPFDLEGRVLRPLNNCWIETV